MDSTALYADDDDVKAYISLQTCHHVIKSCWEAENIAVNPALIDMDA